MIVFVGIIHILKFYNTISFSHWLPEVATESTITASNVQ